MRCTVKFLSASLGIVFVAVSMCAAFTVDTTSRDTTGPLRFKKDTVFEVGFVSTVHNDSVKIRNITGETVTIDHIFIRLHTSKSEGYEIVFWQRLLRESTTRCLSFTGDLRPYELEGAEKIKIPGNRTCLLSDFNIDYRPNPLMGQDSLCPHKGDTVAADLIFISGQVTDTLTLIGVQSRDCADFEGPDKPENRPAPGENRRKFSGVRPGSELEKY
jgi:hypothetical protein